MTQSSVALLAGSPWLNVMGAPYSAKGNNSADDAPAWQKALAALQAKPGELLAPLGNYALKSSGLTMYGGSTIRGVGQTATILNGQSLPINASTLTLDPGSQYASVERLSIIAPSGLGTQASALMLPYAESPQGANVANIVRDVTLQGGYQNMVVWGTDCLFENVYAGSGAVFAAILSHGANWWIRCKINAPNAAVPVPYGFLQGTAGYPGTCENRFLLCDFSGNYTHSVAVDDPTNQADMLFVGCIMSSDILISGAAIVTFLGCKFGTTITNNSSARIVIGSGCYALSPTTVAGNVEIASDVVNIKAAGG